MVERISVKYIENTNADGDDVSGIIVSVSENEILVGVTEKHGGDAEVSLNIKMANELVVAIKDAIELANSK